MSRPKGSKNTRKQDPIFSLTAEERIDLLANLIVDVIIEEQAQQKADDATMKAMSLPAIPIPTDDKSKPANFLRKLDADAKEQGKTGWLELMAEQSPEMADIFKRMVEAEIAAKKSGRKMPGCEQCEPSSATS
ncbi:MAG TPA: hypothetical protein VFT59_06285 [Candidatus Saccharimonadales bacterium]|nr:hypothetical protein [Candidatus Saccharimonadales bacterium]